MRPPLSQHRLGVAALAAGLASLILAGGASATATAAARSPRPAAHAVVRLSWLRHPQVGRHATRALPAGERDACAQPTHPGGMQCQAIYVPAVRGAASTIAGYSPAGLRSAYGLSAAATQRGRGLTIAIVDAFSDPRAAADLATYRSHYRLPACTIGNHCLRIVNEYGASSSYPRANAGWAMEESLDLDMVSAICPNCHIILVEAKSSFVSDLGTGENTAVHLGAKFVSNSWTGPEYLGEQGDEHYFNHPGRAIVFAAGNNAYAAGPQFPTVSQFVTAVGGTSLHHAGGKWTESAWGSASPGVTSGTGSGCSALEPKPAWQADNSDPNGCLNRTMNDVAAVADPATGVAAFDSYKSGGWRRLGGTSAAAPIITATYALAGAPQRGTYPAEYPYLHAASLRDVTTGATGTCEPNRQYLCHGVTGYDGPTGLGTPNGTAAFGGNSAHLIALADPGTQDVASGAQISLRIDAQDSTKVSSLDYSASALPGGLTIAPLAGSSNGLITGSAPAAGTYPVTVTASDGTAHASVHFDLVVTDSMTASPLPTPQPVDNEGYGYCIDAATSPLAVDQCPYSPPTNQLWQFAHVPAPAPLDTLANGGQCLVLQADQVSVAPGACSSAIQFYPAGARLMDIQTGKCLRVSSSTATKFHVQEQPCTSVANDWLQIWQLPGGATLSGLPGLCLTGSATVDACQNNTAENWLFATWGSLTDNNGTWTCLDTGGSKLDGATITPTGCYQGAVATQQWIPLPDGQLINPASGLCLADPGNGPAGTSVTQEDCYGKAGEIWAVN